MVVMVMVTRQRRSRSRKHKQQQQGIPKVTVRQTATVARRHHLADQ